MSVQFKQYQKFFGKPFQTITCGIQDGGKLDAL